MTTKELINSLPEAVRKHLEQLKDIRRRMSNIGRVDAAKEYQRTITGYISALVDMNVIKQAQFRQLYLYYATM